VFNGSTIVLANNQTILTATPTEIDFSQKLEDSGGYVVVVGGLNRFRVPADGAGLCLLGVSVEFLQAAAFEVGIVLNVIRGGDILTPFRWHQLAGANVNVNSGIGGVGSFRFQAGDEIYATVEHWHGSSQDLFAVAGVHPAMWIVFIGP